MHCDVMELAAMLCTSAGNQKKVPGLTEFTIKEKKKTKSKKPQRSQSDIVEHGKAFKAI